ncbi:hypothetical protein GOBAR_AA05367 [Gossypium barbadense]|uniref:Uncharacterized protein n=1 Tax=Gossypium barbadense TaxID=3634 RepID=A0A2P5YHX8_GOSBA|nr:hypothetical protein GOBAR_AA05367 [Gossypium barbadense]
MVDFISSPSPFSIVVAACSLFEKSIALTTSCSTLTSSIEGVLNNGVEDSYCICLKPYTAFVERNNVVILETEATLAVTETLADDVTDSIFAPSLGMTTMSSL